MRLVNDHDPLPLLEQRRHRYGAAVMIEYRQRERARFIVRASYNSPRASEWLAARSGVPVVVLPSTVGGTKDAQDLFALYQSIIERLLNAAK
jgi:zinc/manganese transport system substrate-binding protein